MTSFEEKQKNIFGGEKAEYRAWREKIVVKFLEKGVESIAKNHTSKPPNNGRSSRDKERREWDKSNEIAKGILVLGLDEDFIGQKRDTDLGSSKCFKMLRYLDLKYGGPNNSVQVANFMILTKTPLKPDETMEKFINKYLSNHKEAGTNILDDAKMVADLTLLLGDSERTKASLDHSRITKMSFRATTEHLISEDEHYMMTKTNKILANKTSASSSVPTTFSDLQSPSYDRQGPVSMYANRTKISNTSNSSKPCWYYADNGNCSRGSNCQFRHNDIAIHNINHNKGCSICFRTDHWARDCPNKPNNRSNEVCVMCNKAGHWARDCPMKNSGDRRSTSQSRDRNDYKRTRSHSPYDSNKKYTPSSAFNNASPSRPDTPAPK